MKHLKLHSALLILACLVLSLTSCDKDPAFTPNPDHINFQAPVIGQKNYYARYYGECGELIPSGDTLIWKVIDFNGEELVLEETYKIASGIPHSHVFTAKWSADMIEINADDRQQSLMLNFYGSDFLKLTAPASKQMLQSNCLVLNGSQGFRGDAIGVVPAFRVSDHGYTNKKIVSCVPTIVELDAYLVYDSHNIYSSYSMTKWEFWDSSSQNINAFALIDIAQ